MVGHTSIRSLWVTPHHQTLLRSDLTFKTTPQKQHLGCLGIHGVCAASHCGACSISNNNVNSALKHGTVSRPCAWDCAWQWVGQGRGCCWQVIYHQSFFGTLWLCLGRGGQQ